MIARRRFIVAAALSAGIVGTSSTVRAECDPAKPTEPFASRFEVHGETVYDKSTDLTWTRCSYGQQWTEDGGCSGSVKLLDWHSAVGLHLQEDADWRLPERDELQSIVAPNCKKPAINETVFPGTPSIQYWTKHGKRTVLCVGCVLSDRHANVEFSEDDAVCRAHGPNRPITDHAQHLSRLALRAREAA
jgi:Protein of unknown function (DUF1566)